MRLFAIPLAAAAILPGMANAETMDPAPRSLIQAPPPTPSSRFAVARPLPVALGNTALVLDPDHPRERRDLARTLTPREPFGTPFHPLRNASLVPQIRATIASQQGLLRDRRSWRVATELGLTPDMAVSNGSRLETSDLIVGNQALPLTLGEGARRPSGLGQTARFSAGYRFDLGERGALLVDGDAQGANFGGIATDDYVAQLAAGPELQLDQRTAISLQGLGLRRWFGGMTAVTQYGARLSVERTLDAAQRIGLTIDARRSESSFQDSYTGWNIAAYASYERAIAGALVASASLFARTDQLGEKAYSSNEFGLSAGIGGELPHGINAGITATASRAVFDAPLLSLSTQSRADFRLSGRLYAGLRPLRFMGLSPSISYTYTLNASSLPLYDSSRSRFMFNVARYF